MRTVAMTTAIILKSMLPPAEREISSAACARSGGPRLGNLEGAAIDRGDIENFAGLARGVARDLRVPERVAVFHARVPHLPVDPGVEGGRLAEIQPLHALRAERLLVPMHPDDTSERDDRGADRLPDERAARVADARADQGCDAEDEQVKGSRHQLGDDEDEAGDQPGEGNVHGRLLRVLRGYPTLENRGQTTGFAERGVGGKPWSVPGLSRAPVYPAQTGSISAWSTSL